MKTKSRAGKARTKNGPSKRVGRLVGLRSESAEALRLRWRELELQLRADEKAYDKKGEHVTAAALGGTADGFQICIEDLCREMASANVRQPEPNT